MWRILKGLITGDFHIHSYKIIKEVMVNANSNRSTWDRYILQCVVCGNIKTVNTGKI